MADFADFTLKLVNLLSFLENLVFIGWFCRFYFDIILSQCMSKRMWMIISNEWRVYDVFSNMPVVVVIWILCHYLLYFMHFDVCFLISLVWIPTHAHIWNLFWFTFWHFVWLGNFIDLSWMALKLLILESTICFKVSLKHLSLSFGQNQLWCQLLYSLHILQAQTWSFSMSN